MDLAILRSELGQSGSNLLADVNYDGKVDDGDLHLLAAHWTGDGDTDCQRP